MRNHLSTTILALSVAVFGVAPQVLADPTHNPPLVCAAKASCSSCPKPDGPGLGCIFVTLDLGSTTVWTGQTPIYLRIHSSDETASLSTPAQLKVVMGWSFKAVDGGTTAGGAPQIVRFVQPEGAELVVHFQDGDSVGVPEPNNLGKSLARVQMVDAEGWATTSAPAFYDLYPGDGSVWRFLATGNTNERGALVTYTDPKGRILTMDDFGVDIVRDALGNIRQVKTLTRLADVRTLSPTHYAVTVYPLAEEPEQVADTGLYALPEHAPTRVLDVAQGESVKELLVGFQKGTGDMRQYRYVAVNGDWTLYQPSGLVEAQELYFTEDESGAQRLHTIRDETGKLWSRDEYNYVSAYWGYLITNRIEGIPGDATRTTSWSYYTDGPHKDLLRETVEPTGNRIVYEYDAQNRVIRESMPLVEEETLYSYAPVDSFDPPLLCDTRPRCVVRKMQGVEIQRTYYVYGTNGVDVVERVGEQGAAYGGTNVLRTVTTYYPVTGAVTDGLVQSVRHEDGTIDNYAYDLTDGVWTETITHVHEQAPDIVPMRTTRSVRVYDTLGQLIDSRTDLCTIGIEDLVPQADWTPIERLQYAYDIDGNEIRREDLAGRLWTAEWAGNCCGKVSETDWQGTTKLFDYNSDGMLRTETISSTCTNTTVYHYDSIGQLVLKETTNYVAHIGVPATSFVYDCLGNKVYETFPDGTWEKTTICSNGLVRCIQRSDGQEETTFFDYQNRVKCRKHKYGNAIRYSFFPAESGGYYKNEFGLDSSSSSTYIDMLGRISKETVAISNSNVLEYVFSFDLFGNVERKLELVSDGRTNTIVSCQVFENPSDEQRIVVAFDANDNNRIDYSGIDRVAEKSLVYSIENGAIWKTVSSFVYPKYHSAEKLCIEKDRVMLSRHSSLLHTNELYDVNGLKIVKTIKYDSTNRRMVQDILNIQTGEHQSQELISGTILHETKNTGTYQYFYDALGRHSGVYCDSGRYIAFEYDYSGRISKIQDSFSGTNCFVYNTIGQLVQRVSSSGQNINYAYDDAGRINRTWGTTLPTWYEYDANGRLVALATFRGDPICVKDIENASDPSLDVTRWSYDPFSGNILEKQYNDGSCVSFSYYPSGRLASRKWSRGVVTSYSYNTFGDLSSIAYSDDTPPVQFSYSRLGLISQIISDGVYTNQFYYSSDNLNLELEMQNDVALYRQYDSAGQLVEVSVGDEYRVRYQYDPLSRLQEVSIPDRAASFSYTYSSNLFLPKAITSSFGHRTIRNIEPASGLTHVIQNLFGETNVVSFCYQYDSMGRKVNQMDIWFDQDAISHRFEYNDRAELTSILDCFGDSTFEYDPAGNLRSQRMEQSETRFLVNGLNQIIEVNDDIDASFLYDSDGNMIKDANGWWFEFDGENQIILATNGTYRIHYKYDFAGRLSQKTVVDASGVTNSIKQFIWDRDKVVIEKEVAPVPSITYNYWGTDVSGTLNGAAGVGGLLCVEKNATLYFPQYDAIGNIVSYSDEWGMLVEQRYFTEYGEPLSNDADPMFSLWWNTKTWCPYLQVHEFNYRFYSPALKRWMSRDHRAETQSPNVYLAFDNTPGNAIDPLGLACFYVNSINDLLGVRRSRIFGSPRPKTEGLSVDKAKGLGWGISIGGDIQMHAEICPTCCVNGRLGYEVTGDIMAGLSIGASISTYSFAADLTFRWGRWAVSAGVYAWAGARVYGSFYGRGGAGFSFKTCERDVVLRFVVEVGGEAGLEFGGEARAYLRLSYGLLRIDLASVDIGLVGGGRVGVRWEASVVCDRSSCLFSGPVNGFVEGYLRLSLLGFNGEIGWVEKKELGKLSFSTTSPLSRLP